MKDLTGKRILVLDDELNVRESIVWSLQALGATVTESSNGAEALEFFGQTPFDVVITDYNMPQMKGDAVAKTIKLRCPGQRIVMLSAFVDEVRQNPDAMACIDVLLEKPCRLDVLSAALA